MNKTIIDVLIKSADNLASSATDCATCVHATNPQWADAVDLLDECMDALRELAATLTAQ